MTQRYRSAGWARQIIVGLALVLALEVLYRAAGAPFSWTNFALRLLLIAGLLAAANLGWPALQRRFRHQTLGLALLLGLLGAAGLAYVLTTRVWSAALLLGTCWLVLLALDDILTAGRGLPVTWLTHLVLAALAGAVPVAIGQIEAHFADEEFFVAVWGVLLSAFWLALVLGRRWSLAAPGAARPAAPDSTAHGDARGDQEPGGRACPVRHAWAWWLAIIGVMAVLAVPALRAYQASFYAPAAALPAPWPGITPETPFVCGSAAAAPTTYDGRQVFQDLLAAVAANPYRSTPEYGMLALGTGETRWAQAFRESILKEAGDGAFSAAANSVKSTQYEAALRAYYLPRVRQAFPDLFSSAELTQLQAWFAAINRRAMTVEWVDWMYGAAFNAWPRGPYENQENGAGLLANLQAAGLEDAGQRAANAAYLADNPRGWLQRFRNTDDAFLYQTEWLNNAYFQALASGAGDPRKRALAFEWLLVQTMPDGSAPAYNHPGQPPLAGASYLAATLLNDPRYVWLAGQALAAAISHTQIVPAQPGVERPVGLAGRSPDIGSCLLYGDSGLPNQQGPLAPDKVVLRDGWRAEDAYVLLDLRFSGWHRYKATNAVAMLYQGEPIVTEVLDRAPYRWLPKGRSLFRDKRVPRENLNGLLIPNTGLSAVLYALTGIGSPWAQDPPWSADVLGFQTGPDVDWSHTRLADWRGWQHDRWVNLYHGGPIAVVDRASGPGGRPPALTWHLQQQGVTAMPEALASGPGQRLRLRDGEHPLEVALVPLSGDGSPGDLGAASEGAGRVGLAYTSGQRDALALATIFLPDQWAGAAVSVTPGDQGPVARVAQGTKVINIPLYR